MKSIKCVQATTTLGMGLMVVLATLSGCATAQDDSDQAGNDITVGQNPSQSSADGAGPQAPLEKKSFEFPIAFTSHNSLNLADELKKAVGANELSFANGAAKVSLDPSSVITIDSVGIGGSIQYTQGSLKKYLSLLEGHVSAAATVKVKANVEYTSSFQGKLSKEFKMNFGTPMDKTFNVEWDAAGIKHSFPINVTITTAASVGCDLTENEEAHASLGAELDFNFKGGVTYHNPTGGTPLVQVGLGDLFSFEGTEPKDMVQIKPLDMNGKKTYFTADGSVKATASCWVRPEVNINLLKFVGVTAAMAAEIEGKAGVTATSSEEGATLPTNVEFDWVVTPKLTFQAWGTAGIGTTQVQATDPFKLGEFKWEHPFAGKFGGDITFDPTQQ